MPTAPEAAEVNATTKADASGTLDDEESFYWRWRDAMLAKLRNDGIFRLQGRVNEDFVGLLNQGATCYMNSLLQALFFTTEFRLMMYQFRHDPATHGSDARCIPLQLQRLFAELQLSKSAAISTRCLTDACGFTGRETREQHDLEEFCRVLFTALEESSKTLAEGIDSMFSCTVTNVIRTKHEHQGKFFDSRRPEKRYDIQVPVQGFATLEDAMRSLLVEETMDGDNQWFCEDLGSKVDAVRFSKFEKIPDILCVHLSRFTFDPATWNRKKVTDVISIPELLDLSFLVPEESSRSDYRLHAVCLHSGTAHGGHYHAFVSDGSAWYDANDSTVKRLDDTRHGQLFVPRGNGLVRELRSTDAYFLFYRRCVSGFGAEAGGDLDPKPCVAESELPGEFLDEFKEEERQLAELQRAYRFHLDMRNICVYGPPAVYRAMLEYADWQLQDLSEYRDRVRSQDYVSVQVNRRRSSQDIVRKARQALLEEAAKEDGGGAWAWARALDQIPEEALRLRRFDVTQGVPGAVFGPELGAEGSDAFVAHSATPVLLELAGDGTGTDDVAPESVGVIMVCRWDDQRKRLCLDDGDLRTLHVPLPETAAMSKAQAAASAAAAPVAVGQASPAFDPFSEEPPDLFAEGPASAPSVGQQDVSPSVAALRATAAVVFGVPSQCLALVAMTGVQAGKVLADDGLTLQAAGVTSKDIVCVEAVPPDASITDGAGLGSVILYDRLRNTAKLSYNHPDRPEYSEELGPVAISKDATVFELKASLARSLGLDASALHLCRHHNAPQLKDEAATLRQVGLGDLTTVHVGHGAPCGPDETLIRVSLYRGTGGGKGGGDKEGVVAVAKEKMNLARAAKGSSLVRTLRQALLEPLVRWAKEVADQSDGGQPFDVEGLTWKRLRLRDGAAGKGFTILRDERTLRAALPVFSDGRQVAVQVLDVDEELAADDVILGVRPWRVCDAVLHSPTELIASKSCTLGDLLSLLNARFSKMVESEEDLLEVVVAPAHGPVLSVKRCEALKWHESRLVAPFPEQATQPLSELREVRDGAVLVVRSRAAAARGLPEPAAKQSAGKAAGKGPSKGPKAAGAAPGDGSFADQIAAKAAARLAGPTAKAAAKGPERAERGLVIRVERPGGAQVPPTDIAANPGTAPEAGGDSDKDSLSAPATPSSVQRGPSALSSPVSSREASPR